MFDTVATQLTAVKGSIVNGMSAGSHGLCLCRGLQNFPVTQWHRAARPSSGCSHPRSTLVCQWYDLKGINLICWRDTRRMPIFFLPSSFPQIFSNLSRKGCIFYPSILFLFLFRFKITSEKTVCDEYLTSIKQTDWSISFFSKDSS